jgi:hypothetical protein
MKKRLTVLLFTLAALCAGVAAQQTGLATDFTTEEGSPLVTRGDYVLRGTTLVQYQGKADEVIIPADLGITEIGEAAFGRATLRSVTIPQGVTKLGPRVFIDCYNLESVTLPQSLTELGEYAFFYCSSLVSVNLPASLTSIGGNAFIGCRSLTTITLPAGLTSVGNYAFSGCSGLTAIQVDQANPAYAGRDGVLFNKAFTELIIYPPKKTGTGYAVPAGVTTISGSAFSGCSGLTTITLPAGLTSIGNSAFSGCSGLTTITLPANLTTIGENAFSDCNRLVSITIPAPEPPALNEGLWYSWVTPPTVIYVPAAAVDAYKNAAGWKDYADRIQAAVE